MESTYCTRMAWKAWAPAWEATDLAMEDHQDTAREDREVQEDRENRMVREDREAWVLKAWNG